MLFARQILKCSFSRVAPLEALDPVIVLNPLVALDPVVVLDPLVALDPVVVLNPLVALEPVVALALRGISSSSCGSRTGIYDNKTVEHTQG